MRLEDFTDEICEWCGKDFSSGRLYQRFCCPECREEAKAARNRHPVVVKTCPQCGGQFNIAPTVAGTYTAMPSPLPWFGGTASGFELGVPADIAASLSRRGAGTNCIALRSIPEMPAMRWTDRRGHEDRHTLCRPCRHEKKNEASRLWKRKARARKKSLLCYEG